MMKTMRRKIMILVDDCASHSTPPSDGGALDGCFHICIISSYSCGENEHLHFISASMSSMWPCHIVSDKENLLILSCISPLFKKMKFTFFFTGLSSGISFWWWTGKKEQMSRCHHYFFNTHMDIVQTQLMMLLIESLKQIVVPSEMRIKVTNAFGIILDNDILGY